MTRRDGIWLKMPLYSHTYTYNHRIISIPMNENPCQIINKKCINNHIYFNAFEKGRKIESNLLSLEF